MPWPSSSPRARCDTSGLSEAAPDTIRRAAAVHPISAIETEWSLWDRSIENEVLPLTRELGIGIVPYSPLGRGALTGAISSRTDLRESDHRRGVPWYSEENIDQNLTTLDVVRGIAAELDATPDQVALAWRAELVRRPHPGALTTS